MYKKTEEILNRINDLEVKTNLLINFLNSIKQEIENIDFQRKQEKTIERKITRLRAETAEKFCYCITENQINSTYEDPKYLLKHIIRCLEKNIPFTLNENAKNYWLKHNENKPEEKNSTDLAEQFGLRKNETFTWR